MSKILDVGHTYVYGHGNEVGGTLLSLQENYLKGLLYDVCCSLYEGKTMLCLLSVLFRRSPNIFLLLQDRERGSLSERGLQTQAPSRHAGQLVLPILKL